MNAAEAPPTAFVSYSWDDEAHKAWVRDFAARLRGDGVDVTLDQWQVQPGDRLPAFMEAAVRNNDFVLIVCTPHYKNRSDARQGGVGYEGDIITGELLSQRNERKFIPLLRRGEETTAVPSWLAGKYFIDLRENADPEWSYDDLLTTLLGRRDAPPPLGVPKLYPGGQKANSHRAAAEPGSPVRILGVIVDEVSEPILDDTRGSALYRIPLRLSRRPSAEWAGLFQRTWDNPPRFATMHRPGILRVQGDRIVLDGTTMDELERYHRDTLVLVLEQVNREI
ncbi:MAG: toll/interleukin-1 receptor domain-containing protein, partial [Thermoleophilia bacterium]